MVKHTVEYIQSNKKKIIIAALLILFSFIIFFGIRGAVNSRIMKAETRAGKAELEKQALDEKIEYLDELLRTQSLTYNLIFDGTEESLRESVSSQEEGAPNNSIGSREAAEIIDTLDSYVNEAVTFTIKGDDYLLVVYKDLIGGEVRYREKYVLENSDSIDIYLEREVLPISADANKAGRLIYHWVKVIKIPCGISSEIGSEPGEPGNERNIVIHIIE